MQIPRQCKLPERQGKFVWLDARRSAPPVVIAPFSALDEQMEPCKKKGLFVVSDLERPPGVPAQRRYILWFAHSLTSISLFRRQPRDHRDHGASASVQSGGCQKYGSPFLHGSSHGEIRPTNYSRPELPVRSARLHCRQVNHFVVEGDRVRLKNMPEPSDRRVELDDEGKPLAGVKAKQAAVDFLKEVLEQNDDQAIPLDLFYQHFCDRFSHAVRQEVATNPKELLQFLKLNRAVFFIRSNKVSLVKNRPQQEGSDSGANSVDGDSNSPSDKDNNNVPMLPPVNDNPLERITLVKALKAAQMAVTAITSDVGSTESGGPFVSVDFKCVTLGPQGQEFLTLVVIGTSSGKLFLFDLVHSDSIMLESGLKELLESDQLLKVLHDARRVGTLLTQRYGVNMRNVFDTQVAHSVLQHDKFGKPMHEMRGISFVNLQRVYYPESIMMSDLTPRKLSESSAKK
uniref:3'-5' exonuclease domain-containing protein n=1 Tax=Plectus sambesii TaxID=2011161 RepID=A0A914WRB4_9BILA